MKPLKHEEATQVPGAAKQPIDPYIDELDPIPLPLPQPIMPGIDILPLKEAP